MRYLLPLLAAFFLSTTTQAATAPAPSATPAPAPEAPAVAEATEAAPPTWVYMVARVKLTDTDLTQVVFLRHPAITTMEACEAERTAGLSTGWQYYNRYYLRTFKGLSYKVDYRCVEGEQYLAYWRKGEFSNRYYLVTTRDGKLVLKSYGNFFECRHGLREISASESIDTFCGIGSQAITAPPVDEPPVEAEPESPATAPGNAPAGGAAAAPAKAPAKPVPVPTPAAKGGNAG